MIKIIMRHMDDKTLFCLLKVNKYFRSFLHYDALWKERTLKNFGRGYMGETINCDFYRRLAKSAIRYEIPSSVYHGRVDALDENSLLKFSRSALEYLRKKEYLIRYGDIVYFEAEAEDDEYDEDENDDDSICFFVYDGQMLIKLDIDEDGDLPDIFHVLTPNHDRIFPLDYWHKALPEYDSVWLEPKALGEICFNIQHYNGRSHIQGTFELDQFYTLIETTSITENFSVDTEWSQKIKDHVLNSAKLLVAWQLDEAYIIRHIDFNRTRGTPLYFYVDSHPMFEDIVTIMDG